VTQLGPRRGRTLATVAVLVAAVVVVGILALVPTSDSQESDGAARDLAVTVYNDNLGLVKDRRTVTLGRGGSEIVFTGVAAQLDPTSVHIRPVGNGSLEVASQDYRNDLASTDRLLQRYLDRRVEVHMKGSDVRRGTLVSFDATSLIVRVSAGALSVLNRAEMQEIALSDDVAALASGPTLIWKVRSSARGPQPVEVSYLTGGLTWHAEYVAIQDEPGTSLDIQGWATVENASGDTY
jgi:hypothetical protein